MFKANRFLQKWHIFLSLLLLLSVPAWAEETKTQFKQSPFTLEIKDNLINLQANQASFKKILKDLEKKTEIKVNIFLLTERWDF